jgi:hypothetical protein
MVVARLDRGPRDDGDFPSFVCAGPIFSPPVTCEIGAVVTRGTFIFCDVTPA